jgi:hypothetical protein
MEEKTKLEQRKIQEWIKAFILVVGDVNLTKHLWKLSWYLEYGHIILNIGLEHP